MIDSHCHLDFKDFREDQTEVLARARAAGVTAFICIGAGQDIGPAESALRLARDNADIVATVGIHPHDVASMSETDWARLDVLAAHGSVVGVGETGLDFHYDRSPREVQLAAFRRFLALGATHDKPVVCHVREAHPEAVALLAEAPPPAGGVIHSFSGDLADARRYLDLGLYLSFSGILTFKNAESLRQAAAFAPLDRLLVETDAPYLAPVPLRGRRNEPAFLTHTLQALAAIRGVEVALLDAATETNTRRLFRF